MKKVTFLLSLFFLFAHPSFAQAPVLLDDGYYLIDSDGDTLNKYAYDYIHPRSGSSYLIIHNSSFNYLNPNNYKLISPNGFDIAYPFKGKFGLVGNSPNYHYISENGVLFDTIDYAIEPKVYADFLIYGDSVYKVVDVDGKLIHRSLNPLYTASKAGIFEWDKTNKEVTQYYAHKSSFRKVKRFKNVDTLAFNHQGYAFIEQAGKFCVPSPTGELLFEDQKASNYYLGVAIAWDQYLFLNRDQDVGQYFENEISGFPMYNSASCIFRAYPNTNNLGVELGEPFQSIRAARFPGYGKWTFYNPYERKTESRYLFDEILPSDHEYLRLVRMDVDWFLYDTRDQSVDKLPWLYVHPYGLQSGRFFASNSKEDFWGRAWAYQNLDSLSGGPERYQFIDRSNKKYLRHPLRIYSAELHDLHQVVLEEDTIWLNQKGEIIATEAKPKYPPHGPIDFIAPKLQLNQKDIQKISSRKEYDRQNLNAYLKTSPEGLYLEIANTTSDTTYLGISEGNIDVRLEYKVNDTTWQPITYNERHFMRFAESTALAPMHKFSKLYRLAPGNYLVDVRMRVIHNRREDLVSDPVRISIPGGMIIGHRVPELYALGAWSRMRWMFKVDHSNP